MSAAPETRSVGSRLLAGSIALACAIGSPASASALPKDPEAARLLDEGQVKYKAENFAEAIDDFKKGYEIEADPAFLIAWAQAERQRGRCGAAVRLYQKFLATDPPEVAQEFARDGMVRCADQLAADQPLPSEMSDETDPDDLEEDDTDASEVEPEIVEPPEPETEERPRWYRDPAGTSLVAVGVVGAGVGAGLLVAGAIQHKRLEAAVDDMSVVYGEFDDRRRGIRNLRIAGGVVLGVGGALLLGGVIRWAIVGSRNKEPPASVGFMLDRDHAGLTLSGRF